MLRGKYIFGSDKKIKLILKKLWNYIHNIVLWYFSVARTVAQYLGDVLEDQRDKLQENLLANGSTSFVFFWHLLIFLLHIYIVYKTIITYLTFILLPTRHFVHVDKHLHLFHPVRKPIKFWLSCFDVLFVLDLPRG